MRSPAIAGEEWPGGSGVFQTTLRLGPNSTGRFVSSEIPVELGPRNWGQSAAPRTTGSRRARIFAAIHLFISLLHFLPAASVVLVGSAPVQVTSAVGP